MVNLGISPVNADSPHWLFLHMVGRRFCGLDFDTHLKNCLATVNQVARLCSEFCDERTGLITICNFDKPSRLSRKDVVSKDECWLPLHEVETPVLKVLATQLQIPGFELGLLYLWIEDLESRVFVAAIPIDDDDEEEEKQVFPTVPKLPITLDPPDRLPDMSLSMLLAPFGHELIHA